MKSIKAAINFTLGKNKYIAGEEIKIDDINLINKLNENGFIEPLSYEDLTLIEREIKNKKNNEMEGNYL